MFFCLLEGLSLDGVERALVWKSDGLFDGARNGLFEGARSETSLMSALARESVSSSSEFCFDRLLLLWILGGVEGGGGSSPFTSDAEIWDAFRELRRKDMLIGDCCVVSGSDVREKEPKDRCNCWS